MKTLFAVERSILSNPDLPDFVRSEGPLFVRVNYAIFYTLSAERAKYKSLDVVSHLYFFFNDDSGLPLGHVKCYGDGFLADMLAGVVTSFYDVSGAVFFDDVRNCFVAHLYF